MRKALICVLVFCLGACSQKAWVDRFASVDEQRRAIEIAEELRNGDINKIASGTETQFKADLPRAVAQVKPVLSRVQGPFEIQTVNVVEQSAGPTTKAFTLDAGSGSNWALTEIVFRGEPGSLELAGFHVLPTRSDPSRLNDFNISQRGLLGYIWLLLMFACAALCIIAVFLIWRRPWLKPRWLWTFGSILGFAGFGLNWSTGAWAILFVNVSLLGVTAKKAGPFSPWLLTFGIPVFAIIVIVRWLREVHSKDATQP